MLASAGFAGAAAAGKLTVAMLGDSLTQGYGLPVEDGLVPQLEAYLAAQGIDATLVNAGVSGDTTAGGLSRVGWTLTPEIDAMVVALGGNDLLRGIDPKVARANLDGILDAATQAGVEVMLVGFEAPGNYGPEYKVSFEAIFPELAGEYGAALYPRFFEGLGGEGDLAAVRARMQPDGIHPNSEGVIAIVADFGPAVAEWLEGLAEGASGGEAR
jgi:acyl-CoA thioesterase-1